MSKVLAIGPVSQPVTGQSSAFHAYVENTAIAPTVLTYGARAVKFANARRLLFVLAFLYNLLKLQPDVIYFTSSRTTGGFIRDYFIIQLGSLFGARLVNHLHGADFPAFREKAGGRLGKLIDKSYSKISHSIVLSEAMREQYARYKNMAVDVVPNFFADEYFIVPPDSGSGSGSDLTLLYLSNIIYSKGIFDLLDAVVSLQKSGLNIKLSIAGGFMGDYEMTAEEVERKFISYGEGAFTYHGVVHGKTKVQLLNDADCLVLPTFYPTEAQPLCIIEGMAAGCFIISTKHNYIADLVKPENGVLVSPRRPKELEEAIKGMAKDRDKLLPVKIYNQQFAAENYSLQNYVKSINDIVLRHL